MKIALDVDKVKKLRSQIVLNSLSMSDYENDMGVDPNEACIFFDGYVDYLGEVDEDDGFEINDSTFSKFFEKYDTDENLEAWFYMFEESPLSIEVDADEKEIYCDPDVVDIASLLGENEGIAYYLTTESPVFNCGCKMQKVIVPNDISIDRLDISGCLEDTLHRMIDAGWDDEKIFSVTGMRKVTNEEIDGDVENISVDLGYILPGSLLQWKSEVR